MDVPTIVAILLAVAALGCFAGAWWAHGRRKLLVETPTSPAGALAEGRVEVKGTATLPPAGAMLSSPFTGTPCVHWRFTVEEERRRTETRFVDGKAQTHTTTHWVQVARGEAPQPFGVRDVTGVAVVDPRGADVPATKRSTLRSGTFRDPPPAVLAHLQGIGVSHEGLFGFNKTMRYTEHVLAEGTPLFVLGVARRGPDGRLLIGRGEGSPFLVSAQSEEALLLNYGLLRGGGVVVGFILLGIAAWLLVR